LKERENGARGWEKVLAQIEGRKVKEVDELLLEYWEG